LVGLRMSGGKSALIIVVSLAVWFAVVVFSHPHHQWSRLANVAIIIFSPLMIGLPITIALTYFGALVSRIVREPNVLLPVAFIAMPIDYIGAMTSIGFTNSVVKHHPNIVQHVSVVVPTVGGVSGLHLTSMIGPGDVLFMAFFFEVVQRLNMNVRGTFWAQYGLLTAAMLFVMFNPWHINVAALVPMGLAILIANFRYFRLQRSEVFATFYAAIIVLLLVVGFYWYSHTHFFGHH
jgi:hypothetical protein